MSLRSILALWLLVLGLSEKPWLCNADVSKLLKSGDTAFANMEFGSAVRHYSSAIEQQPTVPLLYTKRAAAYLSLRSFSQALRDLNKAIELDSKFLQGYIHRGKLLRQTCNFNDAKRDFETVLGLKPGNKAAEQELKRLQETQNNLVTVVSRAQLARVRREAAQQQEPDKGGSEGWAAKAAADLRDIRPALQALYQEAPDCVEAQVLEAQLLFDAAEYEQVVALTGRIVKADERHLEALVLRGRAYFYLADNDLAKRHYGEALKFDPDHKEARREFNRVKDYDRKRSRGDKAMEAQDWKEAETLFIEALHVDPDHRRGNEALWFGLCRAQSALGNTDGALHSCEAVLILNSGHREAKLTIVRTLIAGERWEQAVAKSREYLGQHQQDGEFHELAREADRRLKLSKRKNYYKILGVEKSAGEKEIKRAYRELAKKYHPDKVSADERAAAEVQFREIAEAYEILTDEQKRTAYDNGQDVEEGGGGGHGHGHPFGFHNGMHFTFQWE